MVSFSLGAYWVGFLWGNKVTPTPDQQPHFFDIHISPALQFFFIAVLVAGLPFYIDAAFKLFIASESENFFQGLRHEISYGDTDIGPTKYLLSFSFVALSMGLYAFANNKTLLNRILLIVCLLATMVYAVFATGRTFFFLILTLYFGIGFLQNKKFSLRKNSWHIAVFIPLFMVYGIIYGKGGDTESSFKDNLETSMENVAVYLVSSLNAFDAEYTNFHEPNYNGDNTLRFFVKTGQQLHLFPSRKVSELMQGFVFVPYGTNVYTYYSPYLRDFGIVYAFIILFLLGSFHTWICLKAVRLRTFRYTIYYSFLLYPLLMTFFQDQYFSLFSTWIQTVVFVELALLLNKIFLSIRNSVK